MATCIFISLALIFLPGKQGSSATFFDPWTNAKLDHIRNHKKDEEHTPEKCKDITFIDLKSMDKNFTHHAMESGGSRQTGKHFGSVTGANLVPLEVGVERISAPPLQCSTDICRENSGEIVLHYNGAPLQCSTISPEFSLQISVLHCNGDADIRSTPIWKIFSDTTPH